jgi:serine/threonine protein kinase
VKQIKLSPKQQLEYALSIAEGMEYLHIHKPIIVHRDLKSANILVNLQQKEREKMTSVCFDINFLKNFLSLYWIALDWIGLDWIGLDWIDKYYVCECTVEGWSSQNH